jgi:hypothetical protein
MRLVNEIFYSQTRLKYDFKKTPINNKCRFIEAAFIVNKQIELITWILFQIRVDNQVICWDAPSKLISISRNR